MNFSNLVFVYENTSPDKPYTFVGFLNLRMIITL